MTSTPLHVRWLGRVPYREALALQQALFDHGVEQHLLLQEHPHVFTYGPRADLATNLFVDPAAVGADLVAVRRGGDVTYHGPGQLVGYPILNIPEKIGAAAYVHGVEQLVIDALDELGVPGAGRLDGYPGVWLDVDTRPRKIAAIGVRLAGGRTMHGFALNVHTDLRWMREYMIPCGIPDKPVTSIGEEGVEVTMAEVVDVVARLAAVRWSAGVAERQDVAWKHRPEDLSAFSRGEGPGTAVRTPSDHGLASASPVLGPDLAPRGAESGPRTRGVGAEPVRLLGRLAAAGVASGLAIGERKPDWLRPKVHHTADVLALKKTLRSLDLVTVCEEAGCPNLSECWGDGTATIMVLGERCTRACGFCLVDTRKPAAPDDAEPAKVAEAVERMGLAHAVLTMVARDDLVDGGMAHVAACVDAIRLRTPATRVEVLVSDAHGVLDSYAPLFESRPDVFNHNLETVARLQRAVRPSAGYARSLAVLAAARAAGLATKSGLIVGMGETDDEVAGALADLAGVGVGIVTIGQYLRPTSHHLPVARWVRPEQFDRYAEIGRAFGIAHVESSPLTRSSYHARQATDAALAAG